MPVNKITPTARGKAAVLAIAMAAAGSGYALYKGTRVHDDVALAATYAVAPWEGTVLRAYPDPATKGDPWTICEGDTRDVKPGMVETPAGCDKRLVRQLTERRAVLVQCIANFGSKPLSWRAMMLSLAFNVGTGAACKSTAAAKGRKGDYVGSCLAATAYNRAAGRVFLGLVNRREMGDATRIGEAELCVSGL